MPPCINSPGQTSRGPPSWTPRAILSASAVPRPGVSFLQTCLSPVCPLRPRPHAFSYQRYFPDSGRINLSIFWARSRAAPPKLLRALCPVYLALVLPANIRSSLYLATNKLNDPKSSPFSIWASVFPSLRRVWPDNFQTIRCFIISFLPY